MTVVRLLAFLIMFALTVTNGAAIASAMCTHQDARAHMAARTSADPNVAAAALTEESAAKASKAAALAEGAAVALAACMLPPVPVAPIPRVGEPQIRRIIDSPGLASRSVRPLLEPPLA